MTITTRCIITIIIVLAALPLAFRRAAAQNALDDDGSGKTYILAFPDTTSNILDPRFPNNKVKEGFSLFLYSAVGPNKVRITANNSVSIVTLQAGKFLQYDLKSNQVATASNAPQSNTIRLEADKPIVVYCFFALKQSCEAWTPIPVELWGMRYNVAATPGTFVNDIGTAGETDVPVHPQPAPAEFMIIAAFDSTHVDIDAHGRPLNDNGHPLDDKPRLQVTLMANQCYQFQSYVDSNLYQKAEPDIAGIRVTADRPIGLLSGNTRTARISTDNALAGNAYKNMLMEWIPSADQLGTEFVYMPTWDSHRPAINSPAERTGEYVRIYGGLDSLTRGYYLAPGANRSVSFAVPRDTMSEFFFGEAQAVYFKTRSPAMAMMNSTAIITFNGSTPCFQGLPCFSYSAWAPYMVELTPREQWPNFAPYYAPTTPSNMSHYINVVCDTADQKNIYTEQGTPFLFSRKIAGTSLIWGSQGVAQGQDHYLVGKNGAKFAGFVYGIYAGGEEYRPGRARKKGDDLSLLGGDAGVADALHPAEYEEYSALSYAYPLAPRRRILRAADSLQIDTTMECRTLHVTIHSVSPEPVGLRSISLDPASAVNAMLVPILPTDPAYILGMADAKMDVVAIDPSRDASATLIVQDRTGKSWSLHYGYKGEYVDVDSIGSDFGKVVKDQPEIRTITYTNFSDRDIDIRKAEFLNLSGFTGFSIINTTPSLPTTLKPGEKFKVLVKIDAMSDPGRPLWDSLRLTLGCINVTTFVTAQVTQPLIAVNDLDFGTMKSGAPAKTLSLDICNVGDGPLRLLKGDTTGGAEILAWDDADFTVAAAAIDNLQGEQLNAGECVHLSVTFNPGTSGIYTAHARVWANVRTIKDISTWHAVVVDSLVADAEGATEKKGYLLEGAMPNPANGKTEIGYRLGAAGRVTVAIYNAAGERVALLVDTVQGMGEQRVSWDASTQASGLYYCRISSGGWSAARGIVVAR